MAVVGIVQARMGSTRLPGKVMLPVGGRPILERIVRRVNNADTLDEVVVATSVKDRDDVIEQCVSRLAASVIRGPESDVLSRFVAAAEDTGAEVVVRLSADGPLVSPEIIDAVVDRLISTEADYAASTVERTFPRGLSVQAFTYNSFERVGDFATEPYEREHVTPYYYENEDQFTIESVVSEDVFDDSQFQNRTDLRLTLDEADDYELIREIYRRLEPDGLLDIRDAIECIDDNGLSQINAHVKQKSLRDVDWD